MKKNVVIFLVVVLLSASCSRLGSPVSAVDPAGSGMSQVSVNISLEKPAKSAVAKKLAKTATASVDKGDENPAYAFVSVNGTKDSFPVSGWNNVNRSYSLKKGSAYDFDAQVCNATGTWLNATPQSVTGNVPNADSFSVQLNCLADVEKIVFDFPLKKGTKEDSLVDSINVMIQNVTPGSSGFSDFLTASFTPNGGRDTTIALSELLFLPNYRTPLAANNFKITASAFCTDGSLYSCVTNADIFPSTPGSITLTLVRYDPNGSLAKMTVVIKVVSTFTATAVFQN